MHARVSAQANQLDIELYQYFRQAAARQRSRVMEHRLAGAERAAGLPHHRPPTRRENGQQSSYEQQELREVTELGPAATEPDLELAFFNDSIRIVVTRSPTGGAY